MTTVKHESDYVEAIANIDPEGIAIAYKAAMAGIIAEAESLGKVGLDKESLQYLYSKVLKRADELVEKYDLGLRVD